MKIVFLEDGIHAYASGATEAVGGAERQQWYLAKALAAIGWNVVVGVREPLNPGERRSIEGVAFAGIDRGQILRAWSRFLTSEHPDWWYWRSASHLYGPTVALAKLAGVRTIFSAAFDRDVQPSRALSWRRRWWPLYACGLSLTDRIFVQHANQLAGLRPGWRSKARVIRSMASASSDTRSHFDREKYVAWVAMLRQPKRPDILVDIARRISNVHFVVCGAPTPHRSPGGYGERIVRALKTLRNVEFLGQVSSDRSRQIIGRAALLLSTSDEEGFPNTFLEAWADGTPVVSLSIDPENIIEEKGLGVVSRTVAGAVRDIPKLLSATERREDISARAQRHVAEFHSEEAVMTAFRCAIEGVR
jgi:glycosyltransferase involved in cell wall biosynthesis